MIAIPSEAYINVTLEIGAVFKMNAPELIETGIPHYFIVVAIDEEENHMVLCTTQKDKKEEHFKAFGYDLQSLVYIKNDDKNGLTEDTWVNCNNYHSISRTELIEKKEQGILKYVGRISYNHYDQIRIGINISPVNDLTRELLVHPED